MCAVRVTELAFPRPRNQNQASLPMPVRLGRTADGT